MSRKDKFRVIDLGNPEAVYALFLYVAEKQIDYISQLQSKYDPDKDVHEIYEQYMNFSTEMIDWLSAIFVGDECKGVKAKPGWNGPELGRSLRRDFGVELMLMNEEDREIVEDDEGMVFYAVHRFISQILPAILADDAADDDDVEKQGKKLHELLVVWTERFTGCKWPEELNA